MKSPYSYADGYLSEEAQFAKSVLVGAGADPDLAMAILETTVSDERLYDLEVTPLEAPPWID